METGTADLPSLVGPDLPTNKKRWNAKNATNNVPKRKLNGMKQWLVSIRFFNERKGSEENKEDKLIEARLLTLLTLLLLLTMDRV